MQISLLPSKVNKFCCEFETFISDLQQSLEDKISMCYFVMKTLFYYNTEEHIKTSSGFLKVRSRLNIKFYLYCRPDSTGDTTKLK